MVRYEDREEVSQKADYEGGALDFITGYGLSVDDLSEDDGELREALEAFLNAWSYAEVALDGFKDLLPEPW